MEWRVEQLREKEVEVVARAAADGREAERRDEREGLS